MKQLIFSLLMVSTALFVFSCGKDDDDSIDYDYHAHIHSPNADDKQVGDTLHVEVDFESHTGETVHHIQIRIYNKADNTEVYKKPSDAHVHAENGSYSFEDDFVLSNDNGVMADTDWVLEAKVWGHEDEVAEVTATVEFHVHP